MEYENLSKELQTQLRPLELDDIDLLDFYAGSCTIGINIGDRQLNHMGMAHGGIIFTLCDTCAGLTVNSLGKVAVTLSANINYIKSIKSGQVKAVSQTLHNGGSTLVVNVKAYNSDDVLLADANFTMYVIKKTTS